MTSQAYDDPAKFDIQTAFGELLMGVQLNPEDSGDIKAGRRPDCR
jgi:hypothetical protein